MTPSPLTPSDPAPAAAVDRRAALSILVKAAAGLAAAGALAACGKKGEPGVPDGVDSKFPRRYPNS